MLSATLNKTFPYLDPDKDGGLRVTLLVEQYDYMRGPQDSVGALVVIADQDETEAVAKDHGIGVTVGQSVSIGLQKSEVRNSCFLVPVHFVLFNLLCYFVCFFVGVIFYNKVLLLLFSLIAILR